MALQLDTFRGHPVHPPSDFPSPSSVGKPVLVDISQGSPMGIKEAGTRYVVPVLAENAPLFIIDLTRRTVSRTGFVLGIQERVSGHPREYVVKRCS